jgi:hypothetical protein
MESFSFHTAIQESNKVRGSASWVDFVRRAKSPELPVILLEDFAALTGLVFALFGVGLSLLTHNPIFDVMGTTLIGLLLVAVAVVLGSRPRVCCWGNQRASTRRSASLRRCAQVKGSWG